MSRSQNPRLGFSASPVLSSAPSLEPSGSGQSESLLRHAACAAHTRWWVCTTNGEDEASALVQAAKALIEPSHQLVGFCTSFHTWISGTDCTFVAGLRKFWATLRRCRAQRTRTFKAIRLLQPLLPGLRVVEQFGLAVTDAQLLCHLPRENPSCNTARARAGKYSLGASRLQGWPRPQHNLARLHRIQHMCTQCASPEPLSFAAHCL